jgi:hypothetical protein
MERARIAARQPGAKGEVRKKSPGEEAVKVSVR